jgi:predicted kinase
VRSPNPCGADFQAAAGFTAGVGSRAEARLQADSLPHNAAEYTPPVPCRHDGTGGVSDSERRPENRCKIGRFWNLVVQDYRLSIVRLAIPRRALVVLIGPAGSGKSTFAKKHFRATEILSSDFCRGLVADDESDQSASKDAFEVLYFIAAKRLKLGRLTVIDATNVQRSARKSLLTLARKYRVPAVAIVLDLPERLCIKRDRARPDRKVGGTVVKKQALDLRKSSSTLEDEGFRQIYTLRSPQEIDSVVIKRKQ